MASAWEIMTGQTGRGIRTWSQPGLNQLGTRAPSERAFHRERKPRKERPQPSKLPSYDQLMEEFRRDK